MSYTPNHVSCLDRLDSDATGWPSIVPKEERDVISGLCLEAVKALEDAGIAPTTMAVWRYVDRDKRLPAVLSKCAVWDVRLAILHRALLDVAVQAWSTRSR